MPADQDSTDAGGLSRRQLITRGAIAGGLVWAAPVIRTTAAYATTSNGTEKPCEKFFMVVINPEGRVLPAPERIQYHTTPPAIRRWFRDNPKVVPQFPAVKPQLTAVSDEEAAVLLPEVTGPNAAGRQCRLVLGFSRKGETTFAEAFVDPDPPIAVAVGRRIIFPCPRVDESVSGQSVAGANADASTTTTTEPPLGAQASSTPDPNATLGGDGSRGGTLSSDGSRTSTLGGDGRQTTPEDPDHGNSRCFTALYLIYCCPR